MRIRTGRVDEALEQDGYAVVRGVFSADEIAGMRDEAADLLTTTEARRVAGGLVAGPVPAESALARRLLDDPRLAFPCGGELPRLVHVHADTFNDWHADMRPLSQDVQCSAALPWMYKTVIYLEDHPDRNGISVVPGSHRQGNPPGAPLHLGTRAGDIVLFHHSIRHAGRLPSPLLTNLAWGLYRLGVIDNHGRLFRLQHLLQPIPAVRRIAIFLIFAGSFAEINERYAALHA